MDRGRSSTPVNVGDELDVKIEAVGEKGDGIAKVGGFVIFVPNTKEGDSVKIRVTRVLRKVGFAEVIGGAKPGKASAKKPAKESEETEDSEEEPEEDFEKEPEDTEDFGEDF